MAKYKINQTCVFCFSSVYYVHIDIYATVCHSKAKLSTQIDICMNVDTWCFCAVSVNDQYVHMLLHVLSGLCVVVVRPLSCSVVLANLQTLMYNEFTERTDKSKNCIPCLSRTFVKLMPSLTTALDMR